MRVRSRSNAPVVLLFLAASSIGAGCVSVEDPPTGGAVIGALLPFSGPGAADGPRLERGLILAVEHLNAQVPNEEDHFRLVVRDEHAEREDLGSAIDEIRTQSPLAIVGPTSVELLPDSRAALEGSELAQLLPSSTTLGAVPVGSSDAYPLTAPAEVLGCAIADRAFRDRRNRLAVLYADDAHSAAFGAAIASIYVSFESGGAQGEAIALPIDRSNLADTLATVVGFAPDAVAIVADVLAAAQVVRDLTAVRGPGNWYLSPNLLTEEFINNTPPGTVEGALALSIAFEDDARARFTDLYRERFGDEPIAGSFFHYDAAILVGLATLGAQEALGERPGPADINARVPTIANAPGSPIDWTDLEGAAALVRGGTDTNYAGASGVVETTFVATSYLLRWARIEERAFEAEQFQICPPEALSGL